jgi:hypothetical protein
MGYLSRCHSRPSGHHGVDGKHITTCPQRKNDGTTKLRELPFISGSFPPMSHDGRKVLLSAALSGEGMKRCRGLALLVGVLLVVGPPAVNAFPTVPEGLTPHSARNVRRVDGAGFGGFWRRHFGQRDEATKSLETNKSVKPDEQKEHTEYWGGPYWGYGARFGHPCEACRKECEFGKKTPTCDRCRMRCGWSDGIGR